MNTPFFSIMLPAKGRPHLVSDALTSVLRQDFTDFEIIVSNNGADPAVRSAISHLLNDPRIRYFEQPRVLDMPTHWEEVSKLARGRYFLVLPDRSVFKHGALSEIKRSHERFGAKADIVSWTWDLFYDDTRYLLANSAADNSVTVLDSEDTLRMALIGKSNYPYALPRGLNSSVAMEVIQEMRARTGVAFDKLSPDFTFAYQALLLRDCFVYINKSLMISQGLAISNGGNALRGDLRPYLATLDLKDVFIHAPSKAALVENGIIEDFLKVVYLYKRTDLLKDWDRTNYYSKCFDELEEKRSARIVDPTYADSLETEMRSALALETPGIQEEVRAHLRRPKTMVGLTRKAARRLLGSRAAAFRPLVLRARGATKYKTVLNAAGFEK